MVKIPHDPKWQPKMHEYPAGTGFKHHLYQPYSHQNEHCEPGGRNSDELNTDDRTPMDILKTNRNVSKSVQPQVTKLTEEIIENTFMKIGTDLKYSFSSLKDASGGSCTFVGENHSNEAAPQVKSPSEMTEKDPISNLEESCENLVSDTSITNSPCSASSCQQKISQTIVKAAFRREKYTGEESSACLNMVQDVLHQLIERLITDLGTLPLSLPYFIKGTMHDMPYSSVTQLNIMSCIYILMMESKSEVRLVANVIIEIVLEKVYSHILLKVQQEEAAPMEIQIPHTAKFYLKSSDLVDGQNENSYFITNNKPYLRTGSSEVLMQKENGQASSSAVTKELVQQVGGKFESFVTSRLQQISVSEPDFKYGAISELTLFGKRNRKIKETVLPKIQISNPLLIFPSFTSTKDPKILLSRIYVSKSVLEVYAKYVLHDIFQLIQTELKLETYRRTALRGDMVPLANITTATNTVQSLLSDLHYECKQTYFSPIDQFTLPRHQSCGATCTPLIHKPKRTTETPLTVLNVDDVNIFSKRDNENARLPSQIRNSSWKPQNATNLKADRKLKSTQKPIEKRHISKETAIHEETINYLPDISNTSLVPKSVFKTRAERKIKDPLLQYFEQKAERPDSETSTEMAASSERFIAFKMKGKTQTYKTDIEVNSLEGKNGKEEAMMLKSSKLDTFLKPEVSSCALDRICVKTPPDTPANVSQLNPDSDTSLKARAPIKNAVPNSHHNSRQQNTTAHNQFDHMNNLLSKYGILAVSDKSQSVQITDEYQQRQLELGTLANTTFLPQNKCMCTPTTKHAFNNKLNSQREMSPTSKKYSDPLALKLSVQNSTHKNQCSTGKKDETLKTNAIHQYPCFKYIPITYSHADPIYGNIANLNSVSSLHTACGLESMVSEVMIPQVSNVVSHSFPPGELKCSIIKPKESEKAVSQSSTDKSTADVKNVAVPQNTIHKSSSIDQQMSPSSLHLLNAVPKKVVPGVFEKCLPASSFHTKASICDEGLQMSLKESKSYDIGQSEGNEFFEGMSMCENEKYIQIMVEQIHSPKMKYSLSYDVDFRNKSVKPNSFSPVSNEWTLNNLSKSVNGPELLNTEQSGMRQQPSIRDPSHVEYPNESISEKQYPQTASSILPFAELKQVLSTSADTGRHMPPVDCMTSKTICVPIPKPTELTSSSFQQELWKQEIGRKVSTNLSAHTIRQKDHKSYDKRQTPDGNEFYVGNNMCEKEKYIQIMVEQIHSPKMKYSLSYDMDFRNKSVKPNSFSPVSNESTLDSSNNLSKSVNGPMLLNTEQSGMIQQPSIRDPSHVENPTDSISEKKYSQTVSSNLPFAELKQVLSTSAETGRHMHPVDCVTSKTICVPIPKPTELTSSSFQQEQWKQKIGRKLSTNLSAHTIRQKDHKSYDKRQTPDGNEFYEGNNMWERDKYIKIMVEQLHSPKMKYSLSYDVTSSKKSLAGNSFSPVANELEVDSSQSMSTSVKDVVFLNTEETRITKQSSIRDPSYVKNPSQSISEECPQIASANMPMKTATLKQVLPMSAETRRDMPSLDFVKLKSKCVPKTIYASSSNIQQGQRKDGISTILPRDLTELESSRKKSDNVVEQMINGKSVSSLFSKAELMKATHDQHEACPTNSFTTVQSDNIYHKDQCDMSLLNERHSFTGVYPDSFLEDILSGLLSKILFVSSINTMRERVGEPYEGELREVALKCLNSMLAYLTTLQIKIVKADEIIQRFPPIENFDIDEAVHSIYCSVLQEYGSQQAVYTTLINDSDMFAERIIKLVLKQIYNCSLKSSVSEKLISYPCTMLEAGNIIQKVIHNGHKPDNPWQALSLHSTLLFATTCLEDIITNLMSNIFSPSADSATHQGNQTVLSEAEFNAISAQLRRKVLQNISKNKACNTNNSNMNHYLQTELDIQKVVESVHSAVLHVYKSSKAIQTALVSTNGSIIETIAKTIILEVTRYLQPFYSGEIAHTPCTSSAENTVMMLPKTKHCPPSGQSNKVSFGVYTASFLEDVISGLISKIFFTSNGHAEDKNISECDLREIVLNCVNCLIRDLTKYPIEVVTITEETLDDAPNKNDVCRVVDSLFHNVLEEFGSHQAIEHHLSNNNTLFAQRINCLLLAEIVDYQVQPSHSLELSHHQYTTLEANNIVHKIQNDVKKTRDQATPCSSLTTKLSSEFIEDIVIRLISKMFTADGNKYKGSQSLVPDSEFKGLISTFLGDVMSEISNCDIKDTWSEKYVLYSQKDMSNVVDLLYSKMLTKYGTQLAAQGKIRTGSKTVVKGISRYLIKVISSPKFAAVSNGESSSSSNVSSSMSSSVEHDHCCPDVSQDESKVTAHTTVYSSSLVEEVISGSLSNTTEFVNKNSFMRELKPEIGKVELKDLKTKQELLVGSVAHDIEHRDTDLAADHSIEGDLKGASCLMDSNNELQLEKQHPSDGQSVKNKRSSIARMKKFIKGHFDFKGRHSTKAMDSQKEDHDHPPTNQEQGGAVSHFMRRNSGPKSDSSRQNDILGPHNLKSSNQSKETIPSGLNSNATRPNSEGRALLNINSGSLVQEPVVNTETPRTHPPPMSSSTQPRPSSRCVRKRWHQLLWSRVKCCQCTRPEVEAETEEHQYNSTTEETNSTQRIPQDLAECSASLSPAEKLPLSTRASLAKLVFRKKISRIPTKDEKNEGVPSTTKM